MSAVQGFKYDIFISYRHNDNRSGWVTEFVKALQEELAATIKRPISIYFDKNPHDGLLETHNVDKSLEEKIKCIIFIPVLSQTYCEPTSFAWQKEFCLFNKFAKEDQLGRDVKLRSGNITSRILPVLIHELDAEDKAIIEGELGSQLRAIEFIYKEPGVNRSLKSDDDKKSNLNKTDYRNQINKLANAVKELLGAIAQPDLINSDNAGLPIALKHKPKYTFLMLAICISLALAGSLFWWQIIEKTTDTSIDQTLDRAEKLMEEYVRFEDERYKEQARYALLQVLAQDSVNERALYLMMVYATADSAKYYSRKLTRINPNGIYARLANAGWLMEKSKWPEAKEILIHVIEQDPNNQEALGMISMLSLTTQDYINCYRYAKQLEMVNPKNAYQIMATLYLELGDFKQAYRHLELKQALQEFTCSDVEGFQKILLCEGNFEKLGKLTDSLCNFSKCPDCAFWQLRANVHEGKFKEAAQWIGPVLKRMPKITWRYPAFVLLKNGKIDSANLIAQAELDFDKIRLADTSYHQSMPIYSMAAIQAMKNNFKESLRLLRQYAAKGFENGSEWYITHDPLFDELMKDNESFAEFLQLFQNVQHRKLTIREELRKQEK